MCERVPFGLVRFIKRTLEETARRQRCFSPQEDSPTTSPQDFFRDTQSLRKPGFPTFGAAGQHLSNPFSFVQITLCKLWVQGAPIAWQRCYNQTIYLWGFGKRFYKNFRIQNPYELPIRRPSGAIPRLLFSLQHSLETTNLSSPPALVTQLQKIVPRTNEPSVTSNVRLTRLRRTSRDLDPVNSPVPPHRNQNYLSRTVLSSIYSGGFLRKESSFKTLDVNSTSLALFRGMKASLPPYTGADRKALQFIIANLPKKRTYQNTFFFSIRFFFVEIFEIH